VRLVAGNCRDALYKIEDAFRLAAFLGTHCLDDFRRLRLAEATLGQEFGSLVVGACKDALPRCLMPLTKGIGEKSAKRVKAGAASQANREAAYFEWRIVISSKSSTPEIAILANGPEIEACDAERLGAHLGIPAIEAAKVEVRRAIRQPPRLDRIEICVIRKLRMP
jgi:hypothetical protein